MPAQVREADILTPYATHVRYPSAGEDVEEPEYRQALELAERVVRWAETTVTETRA